MASITLQDIVDAVGFNRKDKPIDFHYYGTIMSVDKENRTYQVSINRDEEITVECARLVGAGVGDTVMVTVMANGYATVTGRVGGDLDVIDVINNVETLRDRVDAVITEAKTYVNQAKQHRDQAEVYSTQAGEYRDQAITYRDGAEQAKIGAEQAKAGAETAKTAAETAKTGAEQARTDAETAKTGAETAKAAAEQAQADAETAKTGAEQARTAAETAKTDAETAKTGAETAKAAADTSAYQAEQNARATLRSLSTVEDVVGTLDWITQHGEYRLSTDTQVIFNKVYYTRSGSGTTEDPYVYTEVIPTGTENPQEEGWYNLFIDESIQNYVNTHLSLAGDTLSLQTDGTAARVALSPTDGLVLIGSNGRPLSKFGETSVIGDPNGFHIEITPTSLTFYDANVPAAYISNQQLYIPKSVVLDSMDVGKWRWTKQKNDNLTLQWIGE